MHNVGIVVESLDHAITFFEEIGLSLEGRALSLIHILRAHETVLDLVCRLLLEKKTKQPLLSPTPEQ